ncbi:serpentine type 7TM GPCR chemoreceptor sri domain-containing protein [Ditylenchus destructor]|uniref:Serpentine type 7TM GPCR chemoreceptor sri domain-containing protein n=1 Tax=Ditylenchus destructor TaxID=166010 RepID=A0AAD4NF93_9BILA|nr:serpentine type 7TM GPCR chemoreceptor sri domain-containing protein [Ditylenchus destructor]
MGNYRYFLLNMMQASFILDIYLTVFMQPYPLMPISGYCILGLLTHAGRFWGAIMGVIIMIEFLGIVGASVLTAALYRLAAVYDWQKRMLTKRAIVFFVLAHIFLVSPLLIIAIFVIREVSDQEPIRRQVFYTDYVNSGAVKCITKDAMDELFPHSVLLLSRKQRLMIFTLQVQQRSSNILELST